MRLEYENSKKVLIEKSKTDDAYIKALKSETSKLKAELEKLRLEANFNIGNKENNANSSNTQGELDKVS